MKKIFLLGGIFLVLLTGCASPVNITEVDTEEDEGGDEFITLDNFNLNNHSSMLISDNNTILSEVIGSSTTDPLHHRQFENGLMNIGKEQFGADAFMLANNTPLAENEEITALFDAHPINVTTFFYYDSPRDAEISLSGIVIGLQVPNALAGETLTNTINTASETILNIVRTENVPVTIAVFRQAPINSTIPGNFILKNEIATDSNSLGEWVNMNEQFYLYPSNQFSSNQSGAAGEIDSFMSSVRETIDAHDFFGGSGLALFKDNELNSLSLTINITFRTNTEVVALVQRIGELLLENEFFHEIDLEVTLTSADGVEALLTKSAGDTEMFTHLFH